METAGYVSLFVSAFAAATILPLSSEAVLSALVASDGFDLSRMIAIASLGNTLGACVNWRLDAIVCAGKKKDGSRYRPQGLNAAPNGFDDTACSRCCFPGAHRRRSVDGGRRHFPCPVYLVLLLVAAGKTARYIVVAAIAEKAFA